MTGGDPARIRNDGQIELRRHVTSHIPKVTRSRYDTIDKDIEQRKLTVTEI